mgnify:CR=1 FL=1
MQQAIQSPIHDSLLGAREVADRLGARLTAGQALVPAPELFQFFQDMLHVRRHFPEGAFGQGRRRAPCEGVKVEELHDGCPRIR